MPTSDDCKDEKIGEILPPKMLKSLIALLNRIIKHGYGKVTIEVQRGKPIYIDATETYCPEKQT
jgi:hypothetical protein